MTERLYYTDAYLTGFEARVVGRADEGRRVYLDRSAFYPTSGGQPNDLGLLGGVRVVDVVDEGEQVAHVLEAPLAAEAVHGEVDWPRRFDHMQQHTGQHLLSALFADGHGLETTSVHFGDEVSTLDLGRPDLPEGILASVEQQANEAIGHPHVVRVGFEDAATAAGLRKAPDRTGLLRIVSIDGLDRSACGGTHVLSTAEIGVVLLRRQERVRKGMRVEFVCGLRAVRRARADYEGLTRIARFLSASLDDAATLVESQAAEHQATLAALRRAEGELDERRARERYEATAAGPDGVRRLLEQRASGSPDALKGLGLAVAGFPRALFVGTSAEPPSILLAASVDAGIDAGKLLRAQLERVGGRGGGSARIAQGSVATRQALEALVAALMEGA